MGAGLVGYLLKGPRRLDRDRFDLARGVAANVIGQATVARAAELADECFVRSDFDALADETIDLDCDLERIASIDVDEVLASLISVWEEHGDRDLAVRFDPDDEDRQIVFAGEMSWGDEPDGSAYRALREADQLGLLEIFGIR